MPTTYRLQRCRSHNVHDTPRAWETIQTGTEGEIVRAYHDYTSKVAGASGDLYRIVDADSVEQAVLSSATCGPLPY